MNNAWRINEGAHKNWNKKGWVNRDEEMIQQATRNNPILGRTREERKTDDSGRKTGRGSVGG